MTAKKLVPGQRKPPALRIGKRGASAPGRGTGQASKATGVDGETKIRELRRRIKESAALGTRVEFAHTEIEALIEVVEAASAMFETTLDRNVARRRMERLQVALSRLEER